ncbi:MAG: deoxyribodipyrimidine photo-lyase, partial [Limnohabitans sp.]
MTCQIVWFKRDLRWHDHAALAHAAARGPLRCIYIVEPGYWQLKDTALQHFEFIRESLQALNSHLQALGGCIEIHTGEAIDVFERLLQESPFTEIHSLEETGNAWTYARDLQVQTWCQTHRIQWHEYPQFGVVRRLKNRNQWQAAWEQHMQAPKAQTIEIRFARHPNSLPFSMQAPSHLKHNPPQRQRGGRPMALAVLRSFLNARSLGYRGGISSPLSAPDACSRLSAYLAYGCISMRE